MPSADPRAPIPRRPQPRRFRSERNAAGGARIAIVLAAALALGLPLLLPAEPAAAHTRSLSYSSWTIDGDRVEIRLRVPLLELSRLGPDALPMDGAPLATGAALPPALAARVTHQIGMAADGALCSPERAPRRRADEPGWVRVEWTLRCPPAADTLILGSRFLLDVAPSHLHFARVRDADGSDRVRERVLTEAAPEWRIRSADEPGAGAGDEVSLGRRIADYVGLGIEHILTGWDHLAFVFGLLLLARSLAEVARLVTGFTLAHSLTLALAVQGWVRPESAAVESIIAFSVALVAIEKGWLLADRDRLVPAAVLAGIVLVAIAAAFGGSVLSVLACAGLVVFTACYFALARDHPSEWLRICLTFAFGLVHGFGFAGILVEMALPPDRLVPALLGFNLGVEVGQLGVVLLSWPLLTLGARLAPRGARRLAAEVSAAALCGLGLYWFAARAFVG